MRVLWITNIPMPEISNHIGLKRNIGGGWMESSAKRIVQSDDNIQLAIACCEGKEFIKQKIGSIVYYVLPAKKSNTRYNKSLEDYWAIVREDFTPDIVHIHGTEYAHSLSYIRKFPKDKICVSIQGLISVIAQYYTSGMPLLDFYTTITMRTLIGKDNLWQGKISFGKRGEFEKEILSNVKYVIGRTEWDMSHVFAINKDVKYYHCDETLRDSFYKYKWDFSQCKKHSIFLSQSSYPIKGLHQVIKALALVRETYPDTQLLVAGTNILKRNSFKERLAISGYGRYINKLLNKYNLSTYVTFLGPLSEAEMCKEYLKCNLFVSPSSIENSPNSLGEAQILGTPAIGSFVGGVPEFMKGADSLLYRFEEYVMLANKIKQLFSIYDSGNELEEVKILSVQAKVRHSPERNSMALVNIYKNIILGNEI